MKYTEQLNYAKQVTHASARMKSPIQPEEHLDDAIKRLALERLTISYNSLNAGRGDWSGSIHEARKQFKELRALVRLIRGVLGKEAYRHENYLFRDLGRQLSPIRDRDVIIEKFEWLLRRYESQGIKDHTDELAENLKEYLDRSQPTESQLNERLDWVLGRLDESFDRIRNWPAIPNSFNSISEGVHRVYKKAYAYYNYCYETPTTSNLHEWRKRTKYVRHHYEFIQDICFAETPSVIDEAHKLTEWLGSDHDMAILKAALQSQSLPQNPSNQVSRFIAIIEKERRHLQKKIFKSAEHNFAMKPGRHLDWVRERWEARQIDRNASGQEAGNKLQ